MQSLLQPTFPPPAPILSIERLSVRFRSGRTMVRRQTHQVQAVSDLSLALRRGETLGLVGESGCGKSTLALTVMGLVPPAAGTIHYFPAGDPTPVSLTGRPGQRRDIQLVFQNPFSAMDPRWSVFSILAEPLRVNRLCRGEALRARVDELLEAVGLGPDCSSRFPGEFSGGQRQRLVIARALALRPQLLIADEPVSALDVSVQAQILNLLLDLKEAFHLSYLFISHNIGVIKHVSDRIAVMYRGRIVELGPADAVYFTPRHPYTELLLSAIPRTHPDQPPRQKPAPPAPERDGTVPSQEGCSFADRCPYVQPGCRQSIPPLLEASDSGPAHEAACHRAQALTLTGGPD